MYSAMEQEMFQREHMIPGRRIWVTLLCIGLYNTYVLTFMLLEIPIWGHINSIFSTTILQYAAVFLQLSKNGQA